MKKLLIILSVVPILAVSGMFAQTSARLPFGGWGLAEQTQSHNVPAGIVVDPGSQLNFIVDTGVNMLRPANFTSTQLANNTVLQLTGITGKGDSVLTNFLALTNAHPTKAVTVHVRYFNDACEDLLDFLIVLTCNDTLIFNPFDFNIPGQSFAGNKINAGNIIFGPDPVANLIPAIKAKSFRSGRFLIQVTAAGTSNDADEFAEILFPYELATPLLSAQHTHHCDNLRPGVIGLAAGVVSTNLHAFNASAISFDYLIGHHTVAVPKGFITDAQAGVDQFLAYGVNAWSRPSVDLSAEITTANLPNIFGYGDGDGPVPPIGPETNGTILLPKILTGNEILAQADRNSPMSRNSLYLRNDVHGGDTFVVADHGKSEYGAMGWTSIHPGTTAENQKADLLSIVDDYNGSNNIVAGAVKDFSYKAARAETLYVMQIYDYKEELFVLPPGQQVNISPLPPQTTGAHLYVIVDCLRTWVSERKDALEVDDLSLADLGLISANILAGGGQNPNFAGLQAVHDPLTDASNGWIRFVRFNVNPGDINLVGFGGTTEIPLRSQPGAAVPPLQGTTANASFLTIGQTVLKFEGFGASWWMATVPASLLVSETGDVED